MFTTKWVRASNCASTVQHVLIGELIEIALANVDPNRVEITVLETADLNKEVVGGLLQLVTELADNAIAFSEPDGGITVTGRRIGDGYEVSVSDGGVGIPVPLVAALNEILANPDSPGTPVGSMGIATVARLAARHGLEVRLFASSPGTTARVKVPGRFVDDGPRQSLDSGETSRPPRLTTPLPDARRVVSMSDPTSDEIEAFLEQIFGPFRGQVFSRRPLTHSDSSTGGNGHASATHGPRLQTRVPGANFDVTDDDTSTASGERAVDIRLNLDRFDEGRRAARDDKE